MIMNKFDSFADMAVGFGCQVIKNAELKKYTSFKIGGECKLLVMPNSINSCKELLLYMNSNAYNYHIIGKGSNLIVDDMGFDGIILLMGHDFSSGKCNGRNISCEAGMSLNSLCRMALENNLSGLEFAYGIPGTVGGAVYMNAGAYGGEIKDVLVSVTALDNDCNIVEIPSYKLDLSYRNSVFMHNGSVILKADFKLKSEEYSSIKKRMDELLEKRRQKQPLEYPSAGSTFKRPNGSYASLLVDECGLKGYSVGGAQVSEKHAGFVINKNNASFNDVMTLIKNVQEIVMKKTGYYLECEPEIISDREEYKK